MEPFVWSLSLYEDMGAKITCMFSSILLLINRTFGISALNKQTTSRLNTHHRVYDTPPTNNKSKTNCA